MPVLADRLGDRRASGACPRRPGSWTASPERRHDAPMASTAGTETGCGCAEPDAVASPAAKSSTSTSNALTAVPRNTEKPVQRIPARTSGSGRHRVRRARPGRQATRGDRHQREQARAPPPPAAVKPRHARPREAESAPRDGDRDLVVVVVVREALVADLLGGQAVQERAGGQHVAVCAKTVGTLARRRRPPPNGAPQREARGATTPPRPRSRDGRAGRCRSRSRAASRPAAAAAPRCERRPGCRR